MLLRAVLSGMALKPTNWAFHVGGKPRFLRAVVESVPWFLAIFAPHSGIQMPVGHQGPFPASIIDLEDGLDHRLAPLQVFLVVSLDEDVERLALIVVSLIISFTLLGLGFGLGGNLTLFWAPFPRMEILQLVSFSSFFWVVPLGPMIYPI